MELKLKNCWKTLQQIWDNFFQLRLNYLQRLLSFLKPDRYIFIHYKLLHQNIYISSLECRLPSCNHGQCWWISVWWQTGWYLVRWRQTTQKLLHCLWLQKYKAIKYVPSCLYIISYFNWMSLNSFHITFCFSWEFGPCIQESAARSEWQACLRYRFSVWSRYFWCVCIFVSQQDNWGRDQSRSSQSFLVNGSKVQHAGKSRKSDAISWRLYKTSHYLLQSRVEVFTGDVRLYPNIVSSADVVVMHNVFEFFAPPEVQRDLWVALRQLIKRGALILTSPSLDQALSTLNTNIQLDQWVEQLSHPSNNSSMDDDDDEESVAEMDLVHLYRVL